VGGRRSPRPPGGGDSLPPLVGVDGFDLSGQSGHQRTEVELTEDLRDVLIGKNVGPLPGSLAASFHRSRQGTRRKWRFWRRSGMVKKLAGALGSHSVTGIWADRTRWRPRRSASASSRAARPDGGDRRVL